MSIGIKIRGLRKLKGYTQKEFGLLLGFSEETADVRVTQYETGTRVPKADVVQKMAEILEVNPNYLLAVAPIELEEIMRVLFFLDEYKNVDLYAQEVVTGSGKEMKKITLSIEGMNYFLGQWYEKQKELKKGLIIEEEYFKWKTNWKANDKETSDENSINEVSSTKFRFNPELEEYIEEDIDITKEYDLKEFRVIYKDKPYDRKTKK